MNFPEKSSASNGTILGLDLGANSVGWCLLAAPRGRPEGIVAMGSRVFEAAMEGDISSGKAESRNAERRQARQQRRTTDRRARRRKKLLHALQRAGLLPAGPAEKVIPALDAELRRRHPQAGPHVLPYWLRARALDQRLEPDELGRALYHLGQRRGFLSNRRAPQREGEKPGEVKKAIAELTDLMNEAGARTLGEYLAGLDPEQVRIRQRWTARSMYVEEFEKIWQAQQPHHPETLTDAFQAALRNAIFYQRPLKSVRDLIGHCAHEPGRRRAPQALLCAQRFRLVQQVNNCQVYEPDGRRRPLSAEERSALLEALEEQGDLTFTRAKKLLGLNNRYRFGFEEGGEKRFMGNRTNAALGRIFGDRWAQLSAREKDQVVEDVLSFEKADALVRRGANHWRLDADAAAKLGALELERGYANLSRQAIRRLLPLMERGVPYATAVKEVYGEFHRRGDVLDELPPLDRVVEVRNPVVVRVLAETRRLVNALISKYGKPDQIRIELARDLRQSKAHRQQTWRNMRAREQARERAKGRIVAEMNLPDPRPDDILKVLLADECDWTCPYTGRKICMATLLGDNPAFDIEHIIPFSRSLDDSFFNKTLCYHEVNRTTKGNRTPREAFEHTDDWEKILSRVRAFRGDAANEKLRRFLLTSEEIESIEDFTNRQLADTRYASKLAVQYLSLLYGGTSDSSGRRRIQAGRGGVTKYIRQAFELNRILGDGPGKSRDDHRHHAVDALAIALTDPATVQALSEAAVRAWQRRGKRRHFEAVPEPWEGFFSDVCGAVDSIVTSHRVHRKVRGPLHKDTNYACVNVPGPDGKPAREYRVRKPLAQLSAREVEEIADPAVRRAVREALERAGLPPKQAFADRTRHPVLPGRSGRGVPIHSARVRVRENPRPVGKPGRERLVTTKDNHHLEIVAVLGPDGSEVRWEGHVVDRLEAVRRLREKRPVVQRDHGPGKRFKFSLAPGDTIRFLKPKNEPPLAVVRSVSLTQSGGQNIEFVSVHDARKRADIRASAKWYKRSCEKLRLLGCEKITVSPLGEVHPAND